MRALLVLPVVLLVACGRPEAPPPSTDAEAFTPAVAALDDGAATAWVTDDTTRGASVLWVCPSGGTPVEVARGRIGASPQAGVRLVALSGGALAAVWVEEQLVDGRRFPASTLHAARSDDGGATWSPPVRVHPDPGFPSSHSFHSAGAGRDGALYVAWLDGTARDRAQRHAPPTADAGHTAHHAADGPGTDLVVAASRDGGRTFEAPGTVARGTCECCRTALAVAPDGTVYVAWRHTFDGSERDVALARSSDGGRTFAAPVRVHHDGWTLDGCPHAGPALTVDGTGAVHVAWPTGAGGRTGLWHATSRDGGRTFAAPTALARGPLGQVRAAVGPDGRAWLAWEDAARRRIGLVGAGAADTAFVAGRAPDLAVGRAGPHLAWTDGGRLHAREIR